MKGSQFPAEARYSGPTGLDKKLSLSGLMLLRGKRSAERTRNHYTKEFRLKVAITAVKGEKQLSELAAEVKVHQTLISNWKRQMMEQGAGIFDTKGPNTEQDPAVNEGLVKTIGHQPIQTDWLRSARDLRVVEGMTWRTRHGQ